MNVLKTFLISGIEDRKALRVNSPNFKWSTAKKRQVNRLANTITEISQEINVDISILSEVILNNLFPVKKKHIAFNKMVLITRDYIDTLSESSIQAIVGSTIADLATVDLLLTQWNKFISNTVSVTRIMQTTGRKFVFNKAWRYGNDLLPALNLIAVVKNQKYDIFDLIKHFNQYIIAGCKTYSKSQNFYSNFHFYHIAANGMPLKLLKFMTGVLNKKSVKEIAPKPAQEPIKVDIEAIKKEIQQKFDVTIFPTQLTPLKRKVIKNYVIFTEVFYTNKKLVIGNIYERKPIATLLPNIFKSIDNTIKVSVGDTIDSIKLL